MEVGCPRTYRCWGLNGVLAKRLQEPNIAARIWARRRGKRVQAAGEGRAQRVRQARASGALGGSARWFALMEKEARALLRTLPLLWALVVPVLMVLALASVFRNSGAAWAARFSVRVAAICGLCAAGLYAVVLQQSWGGGSAGFIAVSVADADPQGLFGEESLPLIAFLRGRAARRLLVSVSCGLAGWDDCGGDSGLDSLRAAVQFGCGQHSVAHQCPTA